MLMFTQSTITLTKSKSTEHKRESHRYSECDCMTVRDCCHSRQPPKRVRRPDHDNKTAVVVVAAAHAKKYPKISLGLRMCRSHVTSLKPLHTSCMLAHTEHTATERGMLISLMINTKHTSLIGDALYWITVHLQNVQNTLTSTALPCRKRVVR